ncbi:MAG: beta-propeller domain-containing protein [Deltaproteobacteria bacterium]|nr:beta-propeller domain-containing protein [Deltaproteobacteria bacterium]
MKFCSIRLGMLCFAFLVFNACAENSKTNKRNFFGDSASEISGGNLEQSGTGTVTEPKDTVPQVLFEDTDNTHQVALDSADTGPGVTDSAADTASEIQLPVSEAFDKRSLRPIQDCEAVWDAVRQRAVDEMTTQVETYRAQVLENSKLSPETCVPIRVTTWEDLDGLGGFSGGGGGEVNDDEGATNVSTTNNQVVGVDEADFFKNDNGTIYLLADNAFQILDAWPPADANVISRLSMAGTPQKLFVKGDRAVVYSSLDSISSADVNFSALRSTGSSECTYGYDCDFVGDGTRLKITVIDITDLSNPKVIRETQMNGSYLNARRVDDAVYTVVIFPSLTASLPQQPFIPDDVNYWQCGNEQLLSEEEINERFDKLIETNTLAIQTMDVAGSLPLIEDTLFLDGEATRTKTFGDDCSHFYMSQTQDGSNLISVLGLDLRNQSDYAMASVVSRPGAVYADSDSLYLAMRHYRGNMAFWFFDDTAAISEATTVHRFTLRTANASVLYRGSGVVKGRILNQFSMDEFEGHLRIATTSGRVPSPDVHSTLSVLTGDADGNLTLTGMVDNIAPTEDIRSARFYGEKGFIVTFKKTDPLFVFDLSDPSAPAIVGELKIPGYSTYMHIMDDSHILSIGFDAEDMGDYAYFQGIQLQILDIEDVTKPALLHKEVIGTRGSASDATSNHLAFNYFKTLDQLAIPMVVCEESAGGSDFGDVMKFSGLMVYKVTVADGFSYMGGIPHAEPEVDGQQTGMCNSWWTRGQSQVKRSVFMDDYVYSIASDVINVSNVSDLAHPVASISLIAP